ncbi:MAG: hypothetical protein LBT00_04965 [Spirochaetaceae bacterium]|nr:hypothetical protein [Spirochaetaceae bacterium]
MRGGGNIVAVSGEAGSTLRVERRSLLRKLQHKAFPVWIASGSALAMTLLAFSIIHF